MHTDSPCEIVRTKNPLLLKRRVRTRRCQRSPPTPPDTATNVSPTRFSYWLTVRNHENKTTTCSWRRWARACRIQWSPPTPPDGLKHERRTDSLYIIDMRTSNPLFRKTLSRDLSCQRSHPSPRDHKYERCSDSLCIIDSPYEIMRTEKHCPWRGWEGMCHSPRSPQPPPDVVLSTKDSPTHYTSIDSPYEIMRGKKVMFLRKWSWDFPQFSNSICCCWGERLTDSLYR